MRQAIMCNADMALEGLETTFPDHNGGSDGWDSKHGKWQTLILISNEHCVLKRPQSVRITTK